MILLFRGYALLAARILFMGMVLVSIANAEPSSGTGKPFPSVRFEAEQVGALKKGYGLSTGDVDGDGKPDILLADRSDFAWFRNGDWKRFVLAERLDDQGAMSIEARDIDGDGKVEIAVCTRAPRACIYWLERPKDPTQLWKPVALPSEPHQHRLRWAKDYRGKQYVISVPIQAANKSDPIKVYAYEMPPTGHDDVKRTLLIDTLTDMHDFAVVKGRPGGPERVYFIGDEGLDLMGNNAEKPWTPDGVKRLPGMEIGMGEIDGGRTESVPFLAIIEPKHGHRLVVYRGNEAGAYNGQPRQVLDETLVTGHALECEDVLGIGRDQVIAGWWGDKDVGNHGIRMYVPMNAAATEWKTISIDEGRMACQSLQIADLDGDGRLDMIAAGWTTENLVVYWNRCE